MKSEKEIRSEIFEKVKELYALKNHESFIPELRIYPMPAGSTMKKSSSVSLTHLLISGSPPGAMQHSLKKIWLHFWVSNIVF